MAYSGSQLWTANQGNQLKKENLGKPGTTDGSQILILDQKLHLNVPRYNYSKTELMISIPHLSLI
jgi:hypothetical protein